MKLSVSLPAEDVEFLDELSERTGSARSAVIHRAIALLREEGLQDEYAAAFQEWEEAREAEAWDHAAGDGVPDHGGIDAAR